MDEDAGSLESLLDLAARDEASGMPDAPRPPAEAPEQTLREVQKGVTAGIEPVTASVRRALSMFARAWPPTQPGRSWLLR